MWINWIGLELVKDDWKLLIALCVSYVFLILEIFVI